ncbi:MAG: hypothetical protein GEEBNDBF_02701 [bacterium]|nr:hypothetical protein [bacterium]
MNKHLIWIILASALVLGGLIFWGQHHAMSPTQIDEHVQSAPAQIDKNLGGQ